MPDAIDRWENEGGALPRIFPHDIAPDDLIAGPKRFGSPGQDVGAEEPASRRSRAMSDTDDPPGSRR